ncbi:hypothetical protein [Pseudohaliea sp.]|uniref:hypothetical protein n=1 Tax=Pseudohaliea sp. TaxID=2740289 RepID=UPI0032EF05BE
MKALCKLRRPAAALMALLFLAACSGDPGTGPVEVTWDRDPCTRCGMVLSDRGHAAQVRVLGAKGRDAVHRFDDLGCAVVWLEDAGLADDAVELWVADHRADGWLDAFSAHYVLGNPTPMQYGVSAQASAGPDTIDFKAAREHILRVERETNIHGGNLDSARGPEGAGGHHHHGAMGGTRTGEDDAG